MNIIISMYLIVVLLCLLVSFLLIFLEEPDASSADSIKIRDYFYLYSLVFLLATIILAPLLNMYLLYQLLRELYRKIRDYTPAELKQEFKRIYTIRSKRNKQESK